MLKLHLLESSGRLEKLKSQITKSFEKISYILENVIKLPDIDIVVADNPESAIPETGVGGYAPTANIIYISINPEHPNIESNVGYEIESTITHEVHHCARWKSIGYGESLLEAIISEGLADHFDIEINGGDPKPWSIAIKGEILEDLIGKGKKEFNNTNYNHSKWFFGSEDVQRWAGYSMGYKIVKDYLKKI